MDRFERARESFYEPPDEPDLGDCPNCEGCGYVKEDPFDDHENPRECPECDGFGEIPL